MNSRVAEPGPFSPSFSIPTERCNRSARSFRMREPISYMLYRGEPGDAPHVNRRRSLQAIHGACFAVQAEDFAQLKGFDTHFVNGQEDIDLSLQADRGDREGRGRGAAGRRSSISKARRGGGTRHTRLNRTIFVERWKGKVKPDDRAIYESDGFSVGAYQSDSEGFAERGIAVYTPELGRPGAALRAANRDEGV